VARVLGLARSFGMFWWDFLVGDTPEVLIAALVVVGLAFPLADYKVAATIALPGVAAVLLVASAFRGRSKSILSDGVGGGPEPDSAA
jgi:hypothetical protein